MSNVLFCGSREIGSASALKVCVKIIRAELGRLNFAGDTIIHGGAVGIDSLVDTEAKSLGFRVSIYEPNYRLHGSRAPLARNEDMVRICNEVVAIWNGTSRGTQHTVNRAIEFNKPVRLYRLKNDYRYEFSEPRSPI